MNILYVRNTNFDLPEANKVQVVNMCKAFKENGCNVVLLTFGKDLKKIKDTYKINDYFSIKIIRIKVRFIFQGEIILFLSFLKNFRNYKSIYTRDVFFAFLIKLFFKKKKVILEIHDTPKKSMWKWIYKKVVPKLDYIIVISEGLKEGLSRLGINNDKTIVLHDGVNLNQFDINLSKEDARKKLGLPSENKTIIYVGSTKEERDIPVFIKTAKKMPDLNFVLFGKKQKYIDNAVQSTPNLIFKGYTNNPEIAYKAADILFAGFSKKVRTINFMSPLKIFEYMASKRPIIAADFPRTREILNESDAYFYQSENKDSLVEKIKEIFENEGSNRKKSEQAFKKVLNYTWKKRAKHIIKFLLKSNV